MQKIEKNFLIFDEINQRNFEENEKVFPIGKLIDHYIEKENNNLNNDQITIEDSIMIVPNGEIDRRLFSGDSMERSKEKANLILFRSNRSNNSKEFYENILNHFEIDTRNAANFLLILSDKIRSQNSINEQIISSNDLSNQMNEMKQILQSKRIEIYDDDFNKDFLLNESMKKHLDSIALQMIVNNLYNASLIDDAKKYANSLAKSLFLIDSSPWSKFQFQRIKAAVEAIYFKSKNDIESLILCLAITSHLLDILQCFLNPNLGSENEDLEKEFENCKKDLIGEFGGRPIRKFGVISPEELKTENYFEMKLQCLVYEIYHTIIAFVYSNLDLKGKAAFFSDQLIPNNAKEKKFVFFI